MNKIIKKQKRVISTKTQTDFIQAAKKSVVKHKALMEKLRDA